MSCLSTPLPAIARHRVAVFLRKFAPHAVRRPRIFYLSPRSRHSLSPPQKQSGTSGFMLQVWDTQIPASFDAFADANIVDSGLGSKKSGYVHVRVQQRNGRKSLTTVQGLTTEFNYNKILKDLKKAFCCNGVVIQDAELGKVIQLQGDQRKNASNFLVQAGIVRKDLIKIHGF